jgi:hypothetical protein
VVAHCETDSYDEGCGLGRPGLSCVYIELFWSVGGFGTWCFETATAMGTCTISH